jgi:MFS family permease
MAALTAAAEARPHGFGSVRLVFLMEAVILSAWLPRIPDIKYSLGMDDGQLGLVLVGLPVGTLIGFMVAARFARAVGLRRACMSAGAAFALAFMTPGLAWSPSVLFATLVLSGFIVALVEVAMNTKAGEIEQIVGRRIMSQCHGYWSIGAMIGAMLGGTFAQAGLSVATQVMVLNPLLAALAFGVAWRIPAGPKRAPETSDDGFITLPGKALLLLCLMPIGIMALEGAMMDWSAVFVREVLSGQPVSATAVYVAFAGVMAVTRMVVGDRMAERYGAFATVLSSCLVAALGVIVFATSTNIIVALAGSALIGFGVASTYPLAVSAAAASPGKSPEANVAALSFIAFTAFLVTPPLIGGLADMFSLRIALLAIVPAVLMSALLSGRVRVGR